jgi:hypothetical protein
MKTKSVPFFLNITRNEPGMVVHGCDFSTQEVEVGDGVGANLALRKQSLTHTLMGNMTI